MEKAIRIACTGASALDLDDFMPYQGQLKTLAVDDYNRLRRLIIRLGYIDPIAVWRHEGIHYILDGHQRVYTLRKLRDDEKYFCPPLPIVFVDADTFEEAKEKLLAMSTQFGRIEGDGLYNFIQGLNMEPQRILEDYRFADFSTRDFVDNFYVDPTPVRDGAPDGISELSPAHTPDDQNQIPREETFRPDPKPVDQVSNTQVYKNETRALESFLGSDVRRITIYMNPNDYDQAVEKMSAIAQKFQLKDYRDVMFYLLTQYATDTKNAS